MEWFRPKHICVRMAQSPDLNSTGNLWQDLETAVYRCIPAQSDRAVAVLPPHQKKAKMSVSRCIKLEKTNPKGPTVAKAGFTTQRGFMQMHITLVCVYTVNRLTKPLKFYSTCVSWQTGPQLYGSC